MTYRIAPDGKSITCLRCGRTSWHPEDVRQLYCGNCHEFHEREKLKPPPRFFQSFLVDGPGTIICPMTF